MSIWTKVFHVAMLPITIPVGLCAAIVGYFSAVAWENYCQGYDTFTKFYNED